jgi:oligo-1,6-glucosidase
VLREWWKEAVVYQVYWRSFYDHDGDGVGDLLGIVDKLDYIKSLGVDVIWLNPVYESPDRDNGYDIACYRMVMAKAGKMDDWTLLLSEIHSRGMKLVMDLVVNHTSDLHPWFVESRSSKDSPKRDWYIWRDGKGGAPPNNWRSCFTPSAWQYDEKTGQYYLHSFAVEQPDLNWENPDVREAVYEIMRFWMDRGVDGFRMDVIDFLAKPDGMPDSPDPNSVAVLANNPGIHTYLQEMYNRVLCHYDCMTVGEIPFVGPEDGLLYVGEDRGEVNMLFHFQVLDEMSGWDVKTFRAIQQKWYDGLWGKGWNSQFLNNHDHCRQVTRFGNDTTYRVESAKLLATMIHTLPGTPYVYLGEEIGMTGVRFNSIDDYNDIAMKSHYAEAIARGEDPAEAFERLAPVSRDNSRTPMQWDGSLNAGFSAGTPWLKVNPNFRTVNVAAAEMDPDSVLHYYRKLIALRKRNPIMVYGEYEDITRDDSDTYVYLRKHEGKTWLVILNPNDKHRVVQLPAALSSRRRHVILANYNTEPDGPSAGVLDLRPHEAVVYELR